MRLVRMRMADQCAPRRIPLGKVRLPVLVVKRENGSEARSSSSVSSKPGKLPLTARSTFHATREAAMTAARYSLLVALIFALAAIVQIVRAITGLPITVGQTSIPIWASWIACGVAIVMAWLGYSASKG